MILKQWHRLCLCLPSFNATYKTTTGISKDVSVPYCKSNQWCLSGYIGKNIGITNLICVLLLNCGKVSITDKCNKGTWRRKYFSRNISYIVKLKTFEECWKSYLGIWKHQSKAVLMFYSTGSFHPILKNHLDLTARNCPLFALWHDAKAADSEKTKYQTHTHRSSHFSQNLSESDNRLWFWLYWSFPVRQDVQQTHTDGLLWLLPSELGLYQLMLVLIFRRWVIMSAKCQSRWKNG